MGSNLEIVWSFTNIKFEIVQTNTICYYESVDKQKLKMKDELGKQWYQSFFFHTMVPKCTWKLCNYFVLLNNKWRFLKIPIINCVCFFSLVHFYFQDIKTLLVSVISQNHLLKNMYCDEFYLRKRKCTYRYVQWSTKLSFGFGKLHFFNDFFKILYYIFRISKTANHIINSDKKIRYVNWTYTYDYKFIDTYYILQ